jgi:anti-sigma B factor antagonist
MGERAFTPEIGVESRVETETLSGDVVVLAVHGDADLHFAPQLRDTLDAVIDDGPTRVLVDLSDTVFIDSMALGVLVAGTKRMRADGNRLELVVPNPDLRRIFEITMLDRVLLIHPSLEPAIANRAGEAA